jgi:hypothetical protein
MESLDSKQYFDVGQSTEDTPADEAKPKDE